MTMIGVTAATGNLGRSVIEQLKGLGNVVAIARNPHKAADLPVPVRVGDYSKPMDWAKALEGVEKLLLIGGNEWGVRAQHHKNVVDAAVEAGVKHIVYPSAPRCSKDWPMFVDHWATEDYIVASGLTYTFCRVVPHHEIMVPFLLEARDTGVYESNAHDARLASAGRNDFVEAFKVILTRPGHENVVYEFNGDVAWSGVDFAATASELLGREVVFRDWEKEEYRRLLLGRGWSTAAADIWIVSNEIIESGEVGVPSGHLRAILGRPTTSLTDGLKAALDNLRNTNESDFVKVAGLTWMVENSQTAAPPPVEKI